MRHLQVLPGQQDSFRFATVSAIELLRQVRALSARERRKFVLAILSLEDQTPTPPARVKRVKWPDVEVRAKRIFGKRVLPNLVLLEREEEAY